MKNLLKVLILLSLSISSFGAVVITNGLTQTHTIMSGQKITGKIEMKNESTKPARILIYKQDLSSYCDKSFNYSKPGTEPRSLDKYFKAVVDEKILAPMEQYVLFYTIDLTNTTLEDGSYWSVLMIEGAEPVKEEQSQGMTINSVVRYAVQIIADLGAVKSPKLVFENIEMKDREDAVKVLTFKMKNEGIYSSKTKILVEIYNEEGKKIKTIEGLTKRVYPGQCNDFEIELKDMPAGKYDGIIVADNGKDLFGANVTLDLN
ncbi:MAG: hypothetical protein LCH67_06430 [Bacteroidetes bacterium]|nr:hypothetical protein [Bacteroidota bacterium]